MSQLGTQQSIFLVRRFVADYPELLENSGEPPTLTSIQTRFTELEPALDERTRYGFVRDALRELVNEDKVLTRDVLDQIAGQKRILGNPRQGKLSGKGLAPKHTVGKTLRHSPASIGAALVAQTDPVAQWNTITDGVLVDRKGSTKARVEVVMSHLERVVQEGWSTENPSNIAVDIRTLAGETGLDRDAVVAVLALVNDQPISLESKLCLISDEPVRLAPALRQMRLLNEGLDAKPDREHRYLTITPNGGEPLVIPYPNRDTFRSPKDLETSVEQLTGKTAPNFDELVEGLRGAGVHIPDWYKPTLFDALRANAYSAPLDTTLRLRDALTEVVDVSVSALGEIDIQAQLDAHRQGTRQLTVDYGTELVNPNEVMLDEYGTAASRLAEMMESNGKNLKDKGTFAGQFEKYIVSLPNQETDGPWALANGEEESGNRKVAAVLAAAITPVGGYGEDFSEQLHLTTQIVNRELCDRLSELGPEVFAKHRDILGRHSARGRDAGPNGPRYSMLESVMSLQQSIMQLLGDRIAEHPDPADAMRAIIEPPEGEGPNGLLNRYVQLLTLGKVGPATMNGQYFEHPVVMQDGALHLNETLTDQLSATKVATARALASRNPEVRKGTAVGCPFALPPDKASESGVQELAEVFLETFIEVRKQATEED